MTRTHDLLITNQLLYRLSYTSKFQSRCHYNACVQSCQMENEAIREPRTGGSRKIIYGERGR